MALALGSGLTLLGWHFAVDNAQHVAASRFEARSDELHTMLEARLAAFAQVLRGGQATLGQSGQPDRALLERLYQTLHVDEYPGLTGIVYIRHVPHASRAAVEAAVRRDEPGFTIRPPGEREQYAVVTGVEPRTPSNLPVIGADSWNNPPRRETLIAARDSGQTRITPKLSLVIDDPAHPKPAFLMYQAVYRRGALPGLVDERRASLLGYVAAGVRIDTLMLGTFGTMPQDIALKLHDGFERSSDALFFASHPETAFAVATHSRSRTLTVGGRTWLVDYASLPAFDAATTGQIASWRLLTGGLLVSALLFAVIWSLAGTQARAEDMARRMTRTLRENEGKLRALFEQAPVGIWLVDRSGRIIDCNDKFATYAGAERTQIIGFDMFDSARDPSLNDGLRRAIAGATVRFESPYTSTTGNRSSVYSWHFQPVMIEEETAFVLGFVEDISARKLAEAHIEHLAHHDTLTGLANRSLLRDRLQQAIAAAERNSHKLALFFIDLDFFKHINDTLGHSAGDAMLIEIAGRLRHRVRASDTLARIGGDEFVILLGNIESAEDCMRVAESVIAAIAEPITLDGHSFSSTASIGIAVWPTDGNDSETLTRNADVAMYHAKHSGRNNYQFFTADMNARAQEMALLERSLRDALDAGEFRLHYQAQVDGNSGRLIGAEALLRWQHPSMGLLTPLTFIELAEQRGLINPIGDWVLATACRQAAAWNADRQAALPVSVNISPVQMRRGHLRESVLQALRESGLSPELLTLEITEGAVMDDIASAARLLDDLHTIGVQIEIDDFGTGHSSLAYLKQLPIQRLKVDRSFIRDIPGDPDDAAIVEAIISLASSLKIGIIAEGVETDEQRDFLLARGCSAMQGYRFARPESAEHFAARLPG